MTAPPPAGAQTPAHDRPVVSCVVLAYRSAGTLPSCLRAVSEAAPRSSLEILVVDNASPDDTAAAVRASGVPARLVQRADNGGFAAGINTGVAAARGEFVCLVNPDARPRRGAIDALVDAARRRPGHLLYAGRVETPEGELDAGCCLPLPSLWEYVTFATGLSTLLRGHPRFDPQALGGWGRDSERVVPAASGAFLLARRDEWLAVGGLDPSYFMYSEDTDLSARAHELGRPPLFVPEAVVEHDNGGSSSSGGKKTMVLRGKVTYMQRRWSPTRRRAGIGLLTVGVAARALGATALGRGGSWREAWRRREEWRAGW